MAVNIQMNDRTIDMEEKKNSKKSKKFKVLIILIFIFAITALLCGHFLREKTGFKLSITDILNPIKANPQLQKDASGEYTNFLLVGIDTRENNPGLQNTDTIIVASYNHEKNYSIMTSIPRDFFVEVPNQGRYTKINGIYAIGERMKKDSGLEFLQGVVEEVTGREIQYYAMVNLSGFVDLIDAIGGVEVDVENSFTDYRYPVEGAEHRFQVVSFEEGPQTMDGQTALRFVRSRYSIDTHEASDFARARRQQRVIAAIKDKALSSQTLLNPKKVVDIMNLLDKNLNYSDFTNEELQATIRILQKENMKNYSFVLDPSLARFQIITDKGLTLDAYTVGPTAGLGNYIEIQEYLSKAQKYPLLYSEDPTILIYDIGIGYNEAFEKTENYRNDFPYIDIKYMGSLTSDSDKNYLYTNLSEESELNKQIQDGFSIELTQKPDFLEDRTINGDYIILLGSND